MWIMIQTNKKNRICSINARSLIHIKNPPEALRSHLDSYFLYLFHPIPHFPGNGEKLSQPLPHPPPWHQLSVPCYLHTGWPVRWDAEAVWRRATSNSLLFSGGYLQVQLWQEAVQRTSVPHSEHECGCLHYSCPVMADQETKHTQKNSHA